MKRLDFEYKAPTGVAAAIATAAKAAYDEVNAGGDLHGGAANRIREAISGNICRCTGYIPIVEAALEARAAYPEDWDVKR